MTLRQYITTMAVATLLCWSAWVFVIVNVNPFEAGFASFLFFYASLFLALIGTVSVISFFIYRFIDKDKLPLFRYVQMSFRQSLVVSSVLTGLLYLQAHQWLSVWLAVLLAAFGFILITLTFSVNRTTI